MAKKVSKVMDAKIKFKTHSGTDLEDTLFTSFSIFTFGMKGEAKAAASELKKIMVRSSAGMEQTK